MQQLLARREHAKTRWENRVAEGVAVADLDEDEIRRTLRLGIEAGRIEGDEGVLAPLEILAKLHLVRDGRLLNAAIALFGRSAPGDYPQCRLHLAHFDGLTKDADMADHRPPVYGHAFALAREAEAFLRRRLPRAGRVVPGLFAREDEPLFPTKALREALHNAFAHRDYAHPGGSVHVAIYADRLEVTNAGALTPELTLDDLKRVHESRPRNPLIADVFYLRGLIDEWGRGTRAIVRLCTQSGHPEPEFFAPPGGFGVRLPSARPLGPVAPGLAVTPRQQDILNLLAGGELPLRAVAARLGGGAAAETVGDDLAALKAAGHVGNRGRGRGSTWFILPAALDGVLGSGNARVAGDRGPRPPECGGMRGHNAPSFPSSAGPSGTSGRRARKRSVDDVSPVGESTEALRGPPRACHEPPRRRPTAAVAQLVGGPARPRDGGRVTTSDSATSGRSRGGTSGWHGWAARPGGRSSAPRRPAIGRAGRA